MANEIRNKTFLEAHLFCANNYMKIYQGLGDLLKRVLILARNDLWTLLGPRRDAKMSLLASKLIFGGFRMEKVATYISNRVKRCIR